LVHRDLAARNVLLDSQLRGKVADFGLSRAFGEGGDYYRSTNGMVALRWTAPEAMTTMKFSMKTDIWAYAVVLLEIYIDGETPIKEVRNAGIMSKIQSGYRAKQPPSCPDNMYQLMCKCWNLDPAVRPTFQELITVLSGSGYAGNGGSGGGLQGHAGNGGSAAVQETEFSTDATYLTPGVGLNEPGAQRVGMLRDSDGYVADNFTLNEYDYAGAQGGGAAGAAAAPLSAQARARAQAESSTGAPVTRCAQCNAKIQFCMCNVPRRQSASSSSKKNPQASTAGIDSTYLAPGANAFQEPQDLEPASVLPTQPADATYLTPGANAFQEPQDLEPTNVRPTQPADVDATYLMPDVRPNAPDTSAARASQSKPKKQAGVQMSTVTGCAVDAVGKACIVTGVGSGVIRFVGLHAENNEPRVGVEMNKPNGKNNGTVKGHTYFECKDRHGLLTIPSKVVINNSGAGGGAAGFKKGSNAAIKSDAEILDLDVDGAGASLTPTAHSNA